MKCRKEKKKKKEKEKGEVEKSNRIWPTCREVQQRRASANCTWSKVTDRVRRDGGVFAGSGLTAFDLTRVGIAKVR